MRRILMVASLCAMISYTSCTSEKEEKVEETQFLVTSPIKKDTVVTKDYVCQIQSIRHIELRAQEKGYLQNIYVDEGQAVKKGDLLFKIMPKLYEAEQQRAKAEAEFERIEYENTQKLADSNIVAPNELAMAKAKYEKAKAELALSNVHLGFTEIRAPFDGIIDRFETKLGSLIDEGDLLSNLSDNSEMWVYYNVPEAEYLDFKTLINKDNPEKVQLLMANNKIFDHKGEVKTIEADFNNETGNIPFRATFPNPDRLLRHGETGNIIMSIPVPEALIIPQKATYEVLDKKYVYVVDKDDKVENREVEIAYELDDLYIIKSGIKEGDKILLEGIRKVKDGEKIEYEYEKPEEVISALQLPAE
ncbi:membrane fusion protein, multidrug efflux system [Pustulibacterium marinum]|uniref:Membrane fusion protein, multidrug efflux system n=1 Tax=Pustulibacterium marinum TaxID=1224947 RepID=A0A1I7EUK6_9FLAO|nr:efflux RND transporter periplasmic adaptor subunit [Pustulibacterium marinum]SFU27615.1 membrane fusion protein, multidrug efflux system [Pustulibacterium marinum]